MNNIQENYFDAFVKSCIGQGNFNRLTCTSRVLDPYLLIKNSKATFIKLEKSCDSLVNCLSRPSIKFHTFAAVCQWDATNMISFYESIKRST